MEDNNIINMPENVGSTPPTLPTIKPKRTRKEPPTPPAPVRTVADLDSIDPRKMTPAECVIYIEACREALTGMTSKLNALNETCQKAFEQFRNADTAYKNLKADADARLAFAERAAQVCYESIKLQGGSR